MSAGLDAVDTFAGPGGWDVAAAALGLDVLGIEWDETACLTRKAAGLATVQADVSALNPAHYLSPGQIGSPPCQGFSMAGKGRGRADSTALLARLESVETLDDLLAAIDDMRDVMSDEKTLLALEPLRWALTNLPDWIAWEQVPPVLPLWEACARVLRVHGYSVDTAVLTAEMYGVPQTRKRAILVGRSAALTADLGPVAMPRPTHSKFYSRNPGKLDPGMLKWVSMAEALGLDPALATVSNYGSGGDPSKRGIRTVDQPASTVTSKTDRVKVVRWQDAEVSVCTGQNSRIDAEGGTRRFSRDVNAPAPTVTGQARSWRIVDRRRGVARPVEAVKHMGAGMVERYGTRPGRSLDQPAFTVRANAGGMEPGGFVWRLEGDGESRERLTAADAACLQTFPVNYPWQGAKTQQFQQIGNAIPCLLALHVLCAAAGLEVPV